MLLSQVRLQAAGFAITYGATQRENYHLRKHEVLEFLDTEYLPSRLYRAGSFHTNEPYGIVCSYSKTINEVARD